MSSKGVAPWEAAQQLLLLLLPPSSPSPVQHTFGAHKHERHAAAALALVPAPSNQEPAHTATITTTKKVACWHATFCIHRHDPRGPYVHHAGSKSHCIIIIINT
jgi:hypothetical protein